MTLVTDNGSTIAERIVSEARSWKGTAFQHQGRLKGRGVDCAGFIGEVARDAGVINVHIPHDYRPQEDGTVMMRLLSEHLDFVKTEDVQAGDILALCDEALHDSDVPRHLAYVTEIRKGTMFIIHVAGDGVVEHRTNMRWRQRIHSCWRLRESESQRKTRRPRSKKTS